MNYVTSHKLAVPAFQLFSDSRWADFVDVLLPKAPQDFKHECVRILLEEVEAAQNPQVSGDAPDAPASEEVTP